MRIAFALATQLALPAAATACGGFFCDNSQPVTQAAERILFAPGDVEGTLQMHVQITYGGPPSEFGWLLPVPPDVETGLSNATVFSRLDQVFAPRFRLNIENNCPPVRGSGQSDASVNDAWIADASSDAGAEGPDVQVLSREAVGPYDQAILAAAAVDDLLEWLDENDYNAPEDSADLLQGYIDNGSVFVALKLLPSAATEDVAPIRLQFTADQPVVPIKPTQVAAEPDMGLIIHVVGDARAIPTNYLHVAINERAIDWFSGGVNYPDVVSQAADEANGQAFATDFAGPITENHQVQLGLRIFDNELIEIIRSSEQLGELLQWFEVVDEDVLAALSTVIEPPEGVTVRAMLDNAWDYQEHPVDGAAIADLFVERINPDRERINSIFEDNRYLSRLYTTLSPAEMQADPLFAENGDLDPVSNVHQATFRDAGCFTGNGDLIFSDGSQMPVRNRTQEGLVERQAGATVRGLQTNAAALIERMLPAGQPEVIEQDRPNTSMQTNPPVPLPPRADTDDSGCGNCATHDDDAPVIPLLILGGIVLLHRRRR